MFQKGDYSRKEVNRIKSPVKAQLNRSQIFGLIVTEINAHICNKLLYAIKVYFEQQSFVLEMILKRTMK